MQLFSSNRRPLKLIVCLLLASGLTYCVGRKYSQVEPHFRGPFATHKEKLWLFEALGVEYTNSMHFSDECKALANVSSKDYDSYQGEQTTHDKHTARYGPEIAQVSPTISSIYIRHVSPEVGHGVYARKNFKKGDFIGAYAGEVKEKAEDSTYSWSYPPTSGNVLGKRCSLDGSKKGNELRFINHSEDPNVEMLFVFHGTTWHVIYVAQKQIKKGTQLLTHYGSNYWKSRNKVDL